MLNVSGLSFFTRFSLPSHENRLIPSLSVPLLLSIGSECADLVTTFVDTGSREQDIVYMAGCVCGIRSTTRGTDRSPESFAGDED